MTGQPNIQVGDTYVNTGTVFTITVPVTVINVHQDGYGYWYVAARGPNDEGPFSHIDNPFTFTAESFLEHFTKLDNQPKQGRTQCQGTL